MYILDVLYRIAEKFRRRIFCNFTLKQTFRGIKFPICMLIVCVCAFILMISRINFRELDQITKKHEILTLQKFTAIWYVHI